MLPAPPPDCKGWIDAQRRGCDSSSEGRMALREENKQADIEDDGGASLAGQERVETNKINQARRRSSTLAAETAAQWLINRTNKHLNSCRLRRIPSPSRTPGRALAIVSVCVAAVE